MTVWIPGGILTAYEVHNTARYVHGTTNGTLATASVKLAVPFDSINTTRNYLLGMPCVWPKDTDFGNLYAVTASATPDGGEFDSVNEELMTYDWGFLDVGYTARLGMYILKDDIKYYVEDLLEPRFESIPLNHKNLQWTTPTASGKKLPLHPDEAGFKPLGGCTLVHTVSGYLDMNADWLTRFGEVHNAGYTSPNLGISFAPTTLMLRSMNIVQEFTHNSYGTIGGGGFAEGYSPTFSVTCRYEHKPYPGWNRFWRALGGADGIWDTIEDNQTSAIVYPFKEASHADVLF